ncbi:MAG: STAS domain-containing protein [Bacteroidales bacterium]|nr:STAS domain-containing protein [Bacteroidales bacterium]
MEINVQKKDSINVIALTGRLDTTNYGDLEKVLFELINNDEKQIIVDCKDLDYVSSSGLRIFLMGLKKINAAKGRFVLCGLQNNIKEIFEISGFSTVFEIFGSVDEAAGSF